MTMIKYRVWDNTEQKYDYDGYSIGCDGKLYKSGGVVELAKDYIIEQYTGLKDKNGVEIASGDIVQYDLHFYGRRSTRNMVVEWIRDGETDLIGQPTFSGYLWQGCNYKVIGNIHENAELLEEEK